MAATPRRVCIIEAKLAAVAATLQYTAPAGSQGVGKFSAEIDKFSVTPPAAGSETITVYIVPSGTPIDTTVHKVMARTLANTDRTYTCPELIGHILEPGDAIYTSATAATMVIRANATLEQRPT